MNEIKVLIVWFKNEIEKGEIACFRGAVIHAMKDANVLFHNHLNGNEFRYRYPLIQYKRINRRAVLVCVGEGVDVMGDFFNSADLTFEIGGRVEKMEIDHIDNKQTLIQVMDNELKRYVIRKWLPLSSDNYRTYLSLNGVVEQCSFLQKILVGNVLSLCKGLGVTLEKEVACVIQNVIGTHVYIHKGVKMMGFDVEFKSNVSLPDYIGLGKAVGFGFGTVVKFR